MKAFGLNLIIALQGLQLLTTSWLRARHHRVFSEFFSNEESYQELSEVVLIVLSIGMISIIFTSNIYSKVVAIIAYAFHTCFSYNLVEYYTWKDVAMFVANIVVVFVALNLNVDADIDRDNRERQKIRAEKAKISSSAFNKDKPKNKEAQESRTPTTKTTTVSEKQKDTAHAKTAPSAQSTNSHKNNKK